MNPKAPAVITLTPAQREMIREATGKTIAKLGVEAVEPGSGWLLSAADKQFWLLKHADPEGYSAARQRHQPQINPQVARFRLKIGKSRIHRWGVFAEEKIPARRNVIEYTGEIVNPVEAHRRVKGADNTYAVVLDKFWRVDGAVGGSGAEFINHSCDPNLSWRRHGQRVLCQSKRPIAAGEELTLDYRFSSKGAKVPCHCGSPKCRGTINVVSKRRRQHRGRPQTCPSKWSICHGQSSSQM